MNSGKLDEIKINLFKIKLINYPVMFWSDWFNLICRFCFLEIDLYFY